MSGGPWHEAYLEASARGWTHLPSELLLLGLARSGGVSGEVLAELGATEAAVAQALKDSAALRKPAVGRAIQETPAAQQALGRAEGIAIGLGVAEQPVHLLIALVYDRDGSHAAVLYDLGIDRKAIMERLRLRGIAVPSIDPPPERAPKSVRLTLPKDQANVVLARLDELIASEPRERFFDAAGGGRYGYAADRVVPGHTKLIAEPVVRLHEVVNDSLRSAGFPAPPDDAWDPG